MRRDQLNSIKNEITEKLSFYLSTIGITLYMAANDNIPAAPLAVVLQSIEGKAMPCDKWITEVRVLLNVLGKPSQCDALLDALYNCLHPHNLTLPELSVLLMSMHIESTQHVTKRRTYRKSVMRYVMEEEVV